MRKQIGYDNENILVIVETMDRMEQSTVMRIAEAVANEADTMDDDLNYSDDPSATAQQARMLRGFADTLRKLIREDRDGST